MGLGEKITDEAFLKKKIRINRKMTIFLRKIHMPNHIVTKLLEMLTNDIKIFLDYNAHPTNKFQQFKKITKLAW